MKMPAFKFVSFLPAPQLVELILECASMNVIYQPSLVHSIHADVAQPACLSRAVFYYVALIVSGRCMQVQRESNNI